METVEKDENVKQNAVRIKNKSSSTALDLSIKEKYFGEIILNRW